MQREEEEEEERKIEEYREIGMRLKEFPEQDLRKARKLVSSFIRAAEEVEEVKSKVPLYKNFNSSPIIYYKRISVEN